MSNKTTKLLDVRTSCAGKYHPRGFPFSISPPTTDDVVPTRNNPGSSWRHMITSPWLLSDLQVKNNLLVWNESNKNESLYNFFLYYMLQVIFILIISFEKIVCILICFETIEKNTLSFFQYVHFINILISIFFWWLCFKLENFH